MYGRVFFGVSAIGYGVVSLIWRDSDLSQRLQPLHAPADTIAGRILVVAQIVAGLALMLPRGVRPAAVVLGIVYGLSVVASAAGIVAAPGEPGGYINGFEQLAMVCGAIAAFAATVRVAVRRRLGRITRLMLGVCALSFAWAQIVYLGYTATLVPSWLPPNQVFWTNLTTAAFALAAIAILAHRQALPAMRLLAAMTALFGVLVWLPLIVTHPGVLSNWSEISENYLIAAAAWLVADLHDPSVLGER